MSHKYYTALDAVRFIAAALVMALHFWLIAYPRAPIPVWFGWIGVEIFFVISGVVIANSANGTAAKAFAWHRFLRLYPAVWICATLSLFTQWAVGAKSSGLIVRYLATMLIIPRIGTIEGVYWTIWVELAFYVVIFAVLAAKRFQMLPYLAAFLTVYSGSYVALQLTGQIPVAFSRHENLVNLLLLRHGCIFAVGIWLWLISQRRTELREVGLVVATIYSAEEIVIHVHELQKLGIEQRGAVVPITIWILSVALIWAAVSFPSARPIPWLRRIGLMTYPLYLVHPAIGLAVLSLLKTANLPPPVVLTGAVVSALAVSFLISSYVEPVIRSRLRRAAARNKVGVGLVG
jgi:exopolysaccharide production protein ExoZ